MGKIKVDLGHHAYTIFVEQNLSQNIRRHIQARFAKKPNRLFIISNQKILRHHQAKLKKALQPGFDLEWIKIPDGERYKNLTTIQRIYEQLVIKKADRQSVIIAFGGGVVGDIAGFVAATYMRGVPYFQIPTSLLAMVDSSVGGKTGVDLKAGKNLVGAFYQPEAVFIATSLLQTLSMREFRCGMAEVVKYGLIGDANFFEWLNKNTKAILEQNARALEHLITVSCQMKAKIVIADEKEKGIRAHLNFGHTLGHAIEMLSGYQKIKHGEAVSRGMVYAARLSEKLTGFKPSQTQAILSLLKKLGLPIAIPDYPIKDYQKAIQSDKKSFNQNIGFIVLDRIGSARQIILKPKEALVLLGNR